MADAFLDRVGELAQSTSELHRRAAAMLRELAAVAREAGETSRSEAVVRLLVELDASAMRHLSIACDCHDPTPAPGELPSTRR